jgi:putative transposase
MPPLPIPTIIGGFKSATTRHINKISQPIGATVWQHNYYENIIQDENGRVIGGIIHDATM